jgi:hypothetical protein
VEAISFPVLHRDMAGEGVEQLDVSLPVVDLLPVEMTNVNQLEQSALLDFGSLLIELAWAWPRATGRNPSPIASYTSWMSRKKGSPSSGKTCPALQKARWPRVAAPPTPCGTGRLDRPNATR